MPLGETIVAPATATGRSAIALVRASGGDAGVMMAQVFGVDQVKCVPRRATLGYYRDSGGVLVDQVVYTFFPASSSYTGEDLLEIASHGNPLIVQKIVEDLVLRGCRLAEGGEFTRTAYLNGKLDLSQAEAVCDLITARSERALKSAQRQLAGALGKKVSDYMDVLLQVIAEVEAYIDFPEEDLPGEDADGSVSRLKLLVVDFEELIRKSHFRGLLQEGIKTVIIGPPNAGKSSLLNALIGEDRAIVSAQPGTTRDFISEQVMMGPFCIRMMDTAGLHQATDEIEQMGIKKTVEKIKEADFYLVVVDSSEKPPVLSLEVVECLSPKNSLILYNKVDLGVKLDAYDGFLKGIASCGISLKTEEGVPGFRQAFIKALERGVIEADPEDLIVNARHAGALEKAKVALSKALEHIGRGAPGELVASELRFALGALGEIVGEVDNEMVLDKLFATFCIGK